MSNETKKKKSGCLIVLVVVIAFFTFATTLAVIFSDKNKSEQSSASVDVKVILDATSFIDGNRTISESKLIEMKGEPDEIEEWNYKGLTANYPLRTLHYGNYAFHFNSDRLQRISISEDIPYTSKDDILKMFGLKKYSNSKITDTNAAYRVSNCDVPDFWVQVMDDKKLSEIRISYSTLFEQ